LTHEEVTGAAKEASKRLAALIEYVITEMEKPDGETD
jgi:hypothetical protein